MKNNNLLGLAFIAVSLAVGSVFTASWVFMQVSRLSWLWAVICLLCLVFYLFVIRDVIIPFIKDYRRPKSQEMQDALTPFYSFALSMLFAHAGVSVVLGGAIVCFFYSSATGLPIMTGGFISLIIPLAITLTTAIWYINK